MKKKKKNKKKKKINEKLLIVFGIILLGSVSICASFFTFKYLDSYDNNIKNKKISEDVKYNEIVKIGDNIFEVSFDEYLDDYETVKNYLNETYYGDGSNCTTIYKDGMLLRNLDWYIDENGLNTGELVVHTTASEDRYATIGVAYNPLVNETTYNNLTEEQMKILPFILTDGMNSEGLMFGQNVVPEIDEISNTFGTNPDGEKINFYMLGRLLLDNCANVDEAIEYIKNINLFMVMQTSGYRMESHIMLADKERAVIIEFVDNKVVVLEQEDLPYEQTFMTNHYLYNGGTNTGHGMGYERDEIVKAKYNSIVDWKTGMDVLESVKYSNSYTLPLGDNFWYSEYLVKSEEDGNTYDFNKDTKTNDPEFLSFINSLQEKYENLDGECWWSNHSSVYDTKDKSLHLAIRENYDNIYTFSIDQ